MIFCLYREIHLFESSFCSTRSKMFRNYILWRTCKGIPLLKFDFPPFERKSRKVSGLRFCRSRHSWGGVVNSTDSSSLLVQVWLTPYIYEASLVFLCHWSVQFAVDIPVCLSLSGGAVKPKAKEKKRKKATSVCWPCTVYFHITELHKMIDILFPYRFWCTRCSQRHQNKSRRTRVKNDNYKAKSKKSFVCRDTWPS